MVADKKLPTRWLVALALIAVAAWLSLCGLPDRRLHVHFLDVGQGEAILIQAPDGRQILVDGGPSPTILLNELGEVMPFWDRSLDLLVLTHPDRDHLTGLIPLLERYRVVQALDTPLSDNAQDAQPWLDALARRSVPRTYVQSGARLPVGDVLITVLGPLAYRVTDDDNDNGIILRLDYGSTSLLLTGDAGQAVEAELVALGMPLRSDVLKVGHHGSNGSTSAAFVAAVAPRLVVIQVGADNEYGHPHPQVLARLAPIPVLRTDQHGRIEVISDGTHLWTRTERRP